MAGNGAGSEQDEHPDAGPAGVSSRHRAGGGCCVQVYRPSQGQVRHLGL